MSNTVTMKLTTINGIEVVYNDVLSFHVIKEYYTPYTTLRAEAIYPSETGGLYKKVELILNGYTIHCGLIDNATINRLSNFETITITSKSFTCLLCQNQLEPGLKDSISLNSLVDSFITIPEISHQDSREIVNYIYVKPSSTLWDAVINLTHKLNNGHPYVCNNNTVMVSNKPNPLTLNLTKDIVISAGRGMDTTKIVSDIHMQDINGNYSTYNLNNQSASSLNIVRHKHIDLDRQYLSNPQDALIHKIKFSMRGYYFTFATYNGYNGEDIYDYVNFYDYYPKSRISKLEISGNNGAVTTKVYAYTDKYISYGD